MKVTPEGKVKVLDFGLAKAFAGDGANEDPSNSPTLSMAATHARRNPGHGSVHEPEQARGKAVDKRTDIWAFGCVLYELLTGKAAFQGEDVTEILAAVVKSEPDWTALPVNISPAIRVLLQRCLRKDRRQRISDATDVRIEIEDAIAAPKDAGATQTVPASMSKLLLAVGAVAIVVTVLLGVALGGWWRATRPVDRPLVRLDVDLGPDVSLVSANGADAILSPDGTRMVYVSQGRLSTRRLDQPTATELAGTQGASAPFSRRMGSGSLSSRRENCKRFPWMAARQSPCVIRPVTGAAVGARMATSSLRSPTMGACRRFLQPEVRQRQ